MIPEIGHFALVLALSVALMQGTLPLVGAQRRLSTWTEESELARLNRAPPGRALGISRALAADLALARHWWLQTRRSFDPGVGALVTGARSAS